MMGFNAYDTDGEELKRQRRFAKDREDISALQAEVDALLPDGRSKHAQEMSLLRSQLANCHKEIKRLRGALLATAKQPDPPQLVEVNIRRMETLADSALDSLYEKECQEQMRLAINLLRQAYAVACDHVTENPLWWQILARDAIKDSK